MNTSRQALACVMGDIDLVRPLGLAGIRSAVVAHPSAPARFSRFTTRTIDWVDAWERPEEQVEALVRFGAAQPEPPVLYYEEDRELLLVSRFRLRLRENFRFIVPDATLVENLVDKARFQALAAQLALPVPAAYCLHPIEGSPPPEVDLPFPLIIKPLTRRTDLWEPIGGDGKALQVNSVRAFRELWQRLAAARLDVLAQELIPGPETRIPASIAGGGGTGR